MPKIAKSPRRIRLSALLSLAVAAPVGLMPLVLGAPPAHAQFTGARERVTVQVPSGMNQAPFDRAHGLDVPSGFQVQAWKRVPNARFLCALPNGDLLVSSPNAGKIVLLRPDAANPATPPQSFDFATGMRLPHDIVYAIIGAQTYIYIAESGQINRFVYTPGATAAGARQVVVANLPDASTSELQGRYGHQLKNIAVGPDGKLYVSIASATNQSPSDQYATPIRGAIYQCDADGRNWRLFAKGLRNAEGLAFVPGTNELWADVNNRDNIKYPYNDSTGWYGQVKTEYVNDHPPEEFTRVQDGGNYGWPFANPNGATGMDNMPFDPDYDNNRDWSVSPESTFTRISKGIQAHSAPLGLTFTQNTSLSDALGAGAMIAYHGSWNRSVPTGYKVAFFPWQSGKPGAQTDLITGWNEGGWGRPVDTAVSPRGDLYVSDDSSGTIYRLWQTNAPQQVIVDNNDAGVYRVGTWQHGSTPQGFFGADFFYDGNTAKGKIGARFTPTLPVAGRYEVFSRWASNAWCAWNTPFLILTPSGYTVVKRDQRQNAGQWVSLGFYRFAAGSNPDSGSVWITNHDTRGFVVADAVKFVQVPEGRPQG